MSSMRTPPSPPAKRAVTSSPGALEREAEDVEAAGDVRHGRGGERGDGVHGQPTSYFRRREITKL